MGRVDGDTIDLHGQFVEEAEEILERRIRYARGTGQTHLHVYVHSYSPPPPRKGKRKREGNEGSDKKERGGESNFEAKNHAC